MIDMYARYNELSWERDGHCWPNNEQSQFVVSGGLRWHVQRFGAGPELVFLHGTGASTHSWSRLTKLLVKDYSIILMDLPGHGFTNQTSADRMSLESISCFIGELLENLEVRKPVAIVGHSAGAALAARIVLDDLIQPEMIIGINPALAPFPGPARVLFPTMAKLASMSPLAPRFLSWRAQNLDLVERLLKSTGSRPDNCSLRLYGKLFQSSGHVEATLAMMASWRLEPLLADLGRLEIPFDMIVGGIDTAVPFETAYNAARVLRSARVEIIQSRGHLVHEEDPAVVAESLQNLLDDRLGRKDTQ